MAAKMKRTRTPGIYKRGGRYVVVWRHRGKQHKSFHRTYEEAREAKGRRQAGDSRPASKVRFSDYFDEWIESYAGRTARGLADRSRDLYRRAINDHALRRWGGWRLSDIEPTDVRALYADLRVREVSTSRLRLLRTALSALFTTALEDGIVRMNPVTGVRISPAANAPSADDEPVGRPLTRGELARLLAALPARWRLFFEFLTHTGLRISEAIGLTWEHIELGNRPRVLVREQVYNGKRGRLKSRQGRRDIPLSSAMAERLRALRPEADESSRKPVFVTDAGTELNRPNLAGRVLKPAAKAAGLTVERDGKRVAWVSFHTFRHTCASGMLGYRRRLKSFDRDERPQGVLQLGPHLPVEGVQIRPLGSYLPPSGLKKEVGRIEPERTVDLLALDLESRPRVEIKELEEVAKEALEFDPAAMRIFRRV